MFDPISSRPLFFATENKCLKSIDDDICKQHSGSAQPEVPRSQGSHTMALSGSIAHERDILTCMSSASATNSGKYGAARVSGYANGADNTIVCLTCAPAQYEMLVLFGKSWMVLKGQYCDHFQSTTQASHCLEPFKVKCKLHCWNMQINRSHGNRNLKIRHTWFLTVARHEPVDGLLQMMIIAVSVQPGLALRSAGTELN